MNSEPTIARSHYASARVAAALRADWRGWHLSRKMDGCWQVRPFNGAILTGEIMRDGSFYAFDLVTVQGQNMCRLPWMERRAALRDVAAQFPPSMALAPEGTGPEFIEAVLLDGGEGVVAKPWHAPFGIGWTKIKRSETFDCIVTDRDIRRGSIRLALDGTDAGWCPATSEFWEIQLGNVVEITAYRRNATGKFREARFIRTRSDKAEVMR